MRVDCHQHFWSEPFLAALERRDEVPYGRRSGGRYVVRAGGEVPYAVDVAGERVERRVALLERDGVDRALVALSSPLGIEALPRAHAQSLIAAYHEGARALGERFSAWAPLALDGLGAGDIEEALAAGCAGVSLPAGALLGRAAVEALAPALGRLEELGAPLFVHPGPGLGERAPEAGAAEAPWWSALTTYVGQMQAAWLAFVAFARPAHPRLRVVFAMLAGTAPLLGERLAARGGPPVDLADPLLFYDTSSFGEAAIRVLAALTGERRLLYGSDRPVVEPQASSYVRALAENGAWLVDEARPASDGR